MIQTMRPEDWSKLKYFKRHENWGDPDRMSRELLFELDRLRQFIGSRIVIACGTQGKHSATSQHYLGLAVDVVFPESRPADLLDHLFAAARFNFNGLGLYPYWKHDGKRVGGMHLDLRVLKSGEPKAQWLAAPATTPEGKVIQQYFPLSRFMLIKHGVIGVIA